MNERALLPKLRRAEIVSFEPVTLRAGEISDYYVDIKKAYGNPELLTEMARATLENLDPRTTSLAASGYGGIPLGIAVSQLSGLPLSLVRDKEKNHGKRDMIDGYIPNHEDVVTLLDDVFSTGSSLSETAKTLFATGVEIAGCHVIVARGNPKEFSLPVSFLFKPEDLAEL